MSSGILKSRTDIESDGSSSNFIHKLLGEMKSQFNKDEKQVVAPIDNKMSSLSVIGADESKVNETNSSGSCNLETDKEDSKEVKKLDMEDDTKPRIVLTFRKPSNYKLLKSKSNAKEASVKRSPRRRSRDCNESILQSAIARKEKYNEGYKSQRLTRQLKPTPKILENLANAALLKVEKRNRLNARAKFLENESEETCAISESTSSENKSRSSNKRKLNEQAIKDKRSRRSHRISSKQKDSTDSSVDEDSELSIADRNAINPVFSDGATFLCSCTHKSQLFVSSNNDVVFCNAIDNIGDKLIGCNNILDDGRELSLLRPSSRIPYTVLCKVHLNRMLRHNCCPTCGLFCTQGRFVQCEGKHQFHRDCQVVKDDIECCPHCRRPTPKGDVWITMHTAKKPLFLPTQRAHIKAAKMGFSPKNEVDSKSLVSSPLITVEDFPSAADSEADLDVTSILTAMKECNNDKLAVLLGTNKFSLSSSFEECNGGTLLHYAAQNGVVPVVHVLVMAGSSLDEYDKEQNTPLSNAISAFQDSTVKYLIKAGASLIIKGTDGMTPLHLAAKCGNLYACQQLIEAGHTIKNYINIADDGGWTPLVWASEQDHVEIAKLLICKGADALLRDVEHNLALHWASFCGNPNIVEMLLNAGCDVNAVNVHGDTPLHVGARQDSYNCIILLLARGANVNILNKLGESSLDCTSGQGACYTAISLNLKLQSATFREEFKKTVLSNDISNGKEKNPIQCINIVDDETIPNDFVYVPKNCITSGDVGVDIRINNLEFCKCQDKCISSNCNCCNNSLKCWYDEEGKLLSDFNFLDPPLIFECNDLCSCNAITCNNRVVQHGLTQKFQLFKTRLKGWGIKSLRYIPKGCFVCEYIGEIISGNEADKREDDCYIFDLDSRENDSFCIDAKFYGNFARFINHNCQPNLAPIRVFVEHQDLRFPKISFFASRDISPEEELSFDYGEKFWIIKCKAFTCKCESENCKYSEKTIEATLEKHKARLENGEY